MRLFIKNKILSIGDGSGVYNETGEQVYQVKGKVFSATKKKFIRGMDGTKLYMVRNKFWHFFFRSVYIYQYVDGKKKKLARLKSRFFKTVLDCADQSYTIECKFLKGIDLYKNGQKVAWYTRSSDFASYFIRDAFTLDIFDPAVKSFAVALVIAYDNLCDCYDKN